MTNDEGRRPGLFYYQAASLALLLILVGFTIAGLWGLVGLVALAVCLPLYFPHRRIVEAAMKAAADG